MRKIYPLSDDVIAQIAAGEVIERPAYAIKELVENAIDAHADVIRITLTNSGLKKIIVSDNGEGMSHEDIQECFKPHTTSKITTAEQLHEIHTMGFRGEALASIAAISTMTIKSKRATDLAGTQITLSNGNVTDIRSLGVPAGTTITIDNLFSSVPGRKKFLKSTQTEFRHIVEIVSHLVLAHPEIHFVLIHNAKIIFDVPKVKDFAERLPIIFNKTILEHLIPITYTDAYVTFNGFITKPQITTKTAKKQYLFVNNRSISDKQINQALKAGYGTLLEATASPIFILFLTLPPEVIDVNVHPRKEHITFLNKEHLFTLLKETTNKLLEQHNLTFLHLDWRARDHQTRSAAGQLLKDIVLSDANLLITREKHADIQQMHNLYLVTATRQGFLIIDQHAAHERILYEAFVTAFEKEQKKKELFQLEKPLVLSLSSEEEALLHEHKEAIQNIGFFITDKKLITIPLLFKDWDQQQLLQELIETLQEERSLEVRGEHTNKMLAYLACRSAIKAGDPLTKEQMKQVLDQLEETKNNATCPHGRPVRISVSLQDINRLFKR